MTLASKLLRQQVVQRAGNRCEYCQLSQEGQEAVFHVDHITPISQGGPTALDNLALACVSCSLRKGAQTTGVDPQTDSIAAIYHPRCDVWHEHFALAGPVLIGLPPTGRATIQLLHMNRQLAVEIRREQQLQGRGPLS